MTVITSPQFEARRIEDAKRLILDIIAARGGRFAGKTLLYKTFYLAHLYYWRDHTGTLTDYPIVCMPNGPGLDQGDMLLAALVADGSLEVSQQPNGPFAESVFALTGPIEVDPHDPRHLAVVQALEWIGNKSATEVSRLIHELSHAWRGASEGQELGIYLDLLTDEELATVRRSTEEVGEAMSAAFGR